MSDQNWGPGQPSQNQPPYGQMPPMPPQGYQPPTPAYPYASWISRVFASILDGFVVPLPGVILAISGR